ncbi:MAG: hypothetical protein M0031_07880 [Thermaerobacter sp.]|nr:hypothetical protein [Thermaerobacter sp.]
MMLKKKVIGLGITFVGYLVVSFLYFGLPAAHSGINKGFIGYGSDPTIFIWSLAWWPYAILHGLNPIVSKVVWAPQGVNLAWATSIPGVSLIAAPLTMIVGPVASYNILTILAPALNGTSAYLLIRYISKSNVGAIIGGYIYGFSSFEVGQLLGHMMMFINFPIPLLIYAFLKSVNGDIRKGIFITVAAALMALEFLISTELFASMCIFGGLALAVGMWLSSSEVKRRLMASSGLVGMSLALAMVIVSPLAYYIITGAPHKIFNSPSEYSANLLNFIIPTPITLIGGNVFGHLAHTFNSGDYAEGDAYIGVPLLAICAEYLRRNWHRRTVMGIFLGLIILIIFSLGPILHIGGHIIGALPMPWALFAMMPLIGEALPARFCIYIFLTVGIIVGLWIAENGSASLRRRGVIGLFALLFIMPNVEGFSSYTALNVPRFFQQQIYKHVLSHGENVVIIPYGNRGFSMVYQALSGFWFRMAGGYVTPLPPPSFRRNGALPLLYSAGGKCERKYIPRFMRQFGVGAVIVSSRGNESYFQQALGEAGSKLGGVTVIPVTRGILAGATSGPGILETCDQKEFEKLGIGVKRHLSHGGKDGDVLPRVLEIRGDIPRRYGSGSGLAKNWTGNGGWLGGWGKGYVGIGIKGRYKDVRDIIGKYRSGASAVFYPYPKTFHHKAMMGHDATGLMLIIFSNSQIDKAF